MSNNVWPVLPGLDLEVERSEMWKSVTHETINGFEYRYSCWPAQKYRYKLKYQGVRPGTPAPASPQNWSNYSEMGVILKFLADHKGSFDSFYFNDEWTPAGSPNYGYTTIQRRVRYIEDSLKMKREGKWWSLELELISVFTSS